MCQACSCIRYTSDQDRHRSLFSERTLYYNGGGVNKIINRVSKLQRSYNVSGKKKREVRLTGIRSMEAEEYNSSIK